MNDPTYRYDDPTYRVQVSHTAWEETGPKEDRRARLLTTIWINGLPMHLEAIAVHRDHGLQVADWHEYETDTLQPLAQATGPDGGWQTIRIQDREYVLHACPFS